MKLIRLDVPEYSDNEQLNLSSIASVIDASLLQHFAGKKILLRTLSSRDHAISKEELIKTIMKRGTDRYDPEIKGDRYDNVEGKQIDLFGRICTVKQGNLMSKSLIKGFHIHGAQYHGRPSPKMDIWLVYDRVQLRAISFQPVGHDGKKRDGYIFKNPEDKPAALLGVIVVN